MATLLLQNAGAVLGSSFGPFGTALGRAAGGIAGYLLDSRLFASERVIEGPRLEEGRVMASTDGAPVPRPYGRLRFGGQLIWATRFEEVVSTSRQGGKGGGGGVSVREYAYFANFAVGICEGPVDMVLRVWADGSELDLAKHEIRFHLGSENQEPDPLIEAKQGTGNCPAYRGTTYAVFERLALEDFGNRIPQLSFEVIRSVSRLDADLRAVCIIPVSTEFGYDPQPRNGQAGLPVNRNNLIRHTDWEASIDELTALCPNLETVALVVTWFGTDLRAGECRVEPRVMHNSSGPAWSVGGLDRGAANEVTRFQGDPAYGGTPADASVLAAIADLKARGLKVVLYPFIMMDVPADNALPDPYGDTGQPAYPWRGLVTCHPAAGQPGTADRSALARQQVEAFTGSAQPQHFVISGGAVSYQGPDEWRYRRLVLHYARLAELAGGVDAFLIGSELRGLTWIRDENDAFPFVEALSGLAADVRQIVGPSTKISYAADWSEYFGFNPDDGSGDRFFHLDALWAHADIDAVGIDNYMPLADWRDGGDPSPPDGSAVLSQFDPDYLGSNIEAGEGFDWYYASETDRAAGLRTPITDGQGEAWIWRYKDLRSWWENEHHERRDGGVRQTAPTAWTPGAKPIWFTELGCPAITMGVNEPNVFVDAKSDQSRTPRFSTGVRSDLAQHRFIQAHLDHWVQTANNPVSPVYGGTMVDPAMICLWAWDARPFPAFPSDEDEWSDGSNWMRGHWLNGRLGGCPVDDLAAAIAKDFGVEIETRCDGFVDGYLVAGNASARQALEPLAGLFKLTYREEAERRQILGKPYLQSTMIDAAEVVDLDDGPLFAQEISDEAELPVELGVDHAGVLNQFEAVRSSSRRLEGSSQRQATIALPVVMPASAAAGAAEARLRDLWIGRTTLEVGLPHRHAALSAGDVLVFGNISPGQERLAGNWHIEAIEDGEYRRLRLRQLALFDELPREAGEAFAGKRTETAFGAPKFLAMDLPLGAAAQARVHVALAAEPWARQYAIWSSPSLVGFRARAVIASRAITGTLEAPLAPGVDGRWDRAATIRVRLDHGELAGLPLAQIYNGENACAVRSAVGEWEIIQFANAALQPDGTYLLDQLLRAQLGSDPAMAAGAPIGADFVWLDVGVDAVELDGGETGLTLNWRAGPATEPVSSASMTGLSHTHHDIARRPYSPVHLRARRTLGGEVEISWTRRSRIGGDDWELPEIPLGETVERYRLRIRHADETIAREVEIGTTAFTYTVAMQTADFGLQPSSIRFDVAQLGETGRAGPSRRATIDL